MKKVTIIGPAIIDVIAGPIGNKVFEVGSMPMNEIKMTFGGNGYNEACVLSRLGAHVELCTKIGKDEAGERVYEKIKQVGIHTDYIITEENLATSINVVLFDEVGERRFLTNPNGSLRRLKQQDILENDVDFKDVVCFSCMFISPLLDILSMQQIFHTIKSKEDKILVVDMTKAKNGETIEDLKPLLPYIDYILPNEEELMIIAGNDIYQGANQLLEYGVGCVIVKKGSKGCTIFKQNEVIDIKAYKVSHVIDTTGAGDSFVAGFIYGLINDMPLEDCARFANATASCCVECVGATDGIISIQEPFHRYKVLCQEEDYGIR